MPPPEEALGTWLVAMREHGVGTVDAVPTPVWEAAGRVTAEAVWPRHPSPRFACAAMDGVALRAASAGHDASAILAPGEYERIDTGDPVPPGYDTVVPSELVREVGDGRVRVPGTLSRGAHIRRVGEDIPLGAALLPAGHRLRCLDVAVAGAAGCTSVSIYRAPRVAIIPTGDEIRPLGAELRAGEIADTNSLMLAVAVRELGAEACVVGIQPDTPGVLARVIAEVAGTADLVLVLAGSSAGPDDHTAAVVRALGTVVVHGVAVRPAHPTLLGLLGTSPDAKPVIGVPGYPAAAMLAFDLFARPLLAWLEGTRPAPRHRVEAVLAGTVGSARPAEEWIRVQLMDQVGGLPVALPRPGGAGALRSLAHAHGLVRIPAGCGPLAAGTPVEVHRFEGTPACEVGTAPASPLSWPRSPSRTA